MIVGRGVNNDAATTTLLSFLANTRKKTADEECVPPLYINMRKQALNSEIHPPLNPAVAKRWVGLSSSPLLAAIMPIEQAK